MFRFTIRDVLWLTVAVALALGWCAERANTTRIASERDLLVRLLANENTPHWKLSPELLRATRPLER